MWFTVPAEAWLGYPTHNKLFMGPSTLVVYAFFPHFSNTGNKDELTLLGDSIT